MLELLAPCGTHAGKRAMNVPVEGEFPSILPPGLPHARSANMLNAKNWGAVFMHNGPALAAFTKKLLVPSCFHAGSSDLKVVDNLDSGTSAEKSWRRSP